MGKPRSALVLELKLPGGLPPLVFVGTHLDYRRDDQERFECAQAIAALMEEYPGRPAVLSGDFAAFPNSRVLAEFDKSWTRTSETILPTYPAERPLSQLIYVMVRPAAAWKIIETKTLDDVTFVQHRPILAVLELQPQPEE